MHSFNLLYIFLLTLLGVAVALPEYTTAPLTARILAPLIPLSPTDDPFYAAPTDLASYSPGEIIRDRAVATADDTSNAATVYQVLYRTTNALGQPDSTVGTLFSPRKPSLTPSGKAKVFALAIPSDSASLDCQPSYSLLKGSLSKARLAFLPSIFSISIQIALGKGWYVVVPDYLGSDAAWMAGEQTGKAFIDGVRAFFNHKPTFEGSDNDANVVLYGYSGGAAATSWAARLLASYAPELPVKGIWSGGIPADLGMLVETLNSKFYAGFIFASIAGVSAAYPALEAKLRTKFTPAGLDLIRSFRNNKCLPDILLGNAGKNVYDYTASKDVFEQSDVLRALRTNSLTMAPGAVGNRAAAPQIPQWIAHSKSDEIIDVRMVDTYVSEQCALGANIRYTTFKGPSHIGMALAGLSSAYLWMDAALEERTGQTGCSTEDGFPFFFQGQEAKLSDAEDKQLKDLTNAGGPLSFNF